MKFIQGSLRSSANSSTYSASFYDGDCNGIDVAGETEIDDTTQEFYYGEWKNDKRNGNFYGFVMNKLFYVCSLPHHLFKKKLTIN